MKQYGAFAQYYDALTRNVGYAQRARYFHGLIAQYREVPGNLLLDLACGTGSMSEEFARLGYDVIGVDASPEMLDAAMDKKFDSGLPIQYLCQDMRALDMYGTIDVTVCLLDSLNHLPGLADVEQVFARVSLFAQPGGLFLFDVNTLYKHREVLGNQTFVYDTESVYCVWENHLLPDGDTVEISLDFFEREGEHYLRSSEQFKERAYSIETLDVALARAGLTVLAHYDADTQKPPHETSERVIFVVRK